MRAGIGRTAPDLQSLSSISGLTYGTRFTREEAAQH